MAGRTYGQHCGLAAAMDLVGQRWAMLVIRELAPGPRRFTDIHEGLPGLATDVLAERLRELVAAGVVEHRSVRHPVPAKVYALTESGRSLAAIAGQLAEWGGPLLPTNPDEGTVVRARWALQMMTRRYRGGMPDGDYKFVIDDEPLTVRVAGETATLRYGPAPAGAAVSIACSSTQFFKAARQPSWLATDHRGVVVNGAREDAVALFDALGFIGGGVAPGR